MPDLAIKNKNIIEIIDNNIEARLSIKSMGRVLVIFDCIELLTSFIDSKHLDDMQIQVVLLLDDDLSNFNKSIKVMSNQASLSGYFSNYAIFDQSNSYQGDIVVDYSKHKLLSRARLGYFYKPDDSALKDIQLLVGDFEKPIYINIEHSKCAFGNGYLEGCRKCIDHCEVQAISVEKNEIKINQTACQGNGDCVSVCPSGAISYQVPKLDYLLSIIYLSIKDHIKENTSNLCIIFTSFDDPIAESENSNNILFIKLESIEIIDIPTLLLCFCYGARQIFFDENSIGPTLKDTIKRTNDLLILLGYVPAINNKDNYFELKNLLEQKPLSYKRENLFLAIDHLFKQTGLDVCSLELKSSYDIGGVQINPDYCTLCMGCVNICPSKALIDKGEYPAILFKEENCLQCGLCKEVCPESAINLYASLELDIKKRKSYRVLHKEQPALCRQCKKPFASQKALTVIESKLKGNPLFMNNNIKDTIYLCGECKVLRMLELDS